MYPINLTLEITQTGFIVRYFGKKYFEYKKPNENSVFQYPYEAQKYVYNWFGYRYISKQYFAELIANTLDDKTAIHLFWRVIDEYTNFGE